MDPSVYHALNNFAYAHTWVADIAKFFAQDMVFILVGVFGLLWLIRTGRGWLLDQGSRVAVFAGAVALVLGLLIVQVIGHIWDRPRPFVALHHFHKLIPHAADASFPSDHVTGSAALAFALILFGRRWMGSVALVIAVLIGVARVMVGIHWPTDILGAIGVGAISAFLVFLARGPITRLADWCSALYARVLDALGRVVNPRAHRTGT
ncbi:MAG TPA: undecaprenyl-diphosphatase [Solirubrobacteraceae bacterium]|nr:undecaprenyl-diphosphatase [Solirubrobacteraceae bacterium]